MHGKPRVAQSAVLLHPVLVHIKPYKECMQIQLQALEGPPVDVDAVVDALLAADLSPAALAAAEAAASSRPAARKPVGAHHVSPCGCVLACQVWMHVVGSS